MNKIILGLLLFFSISGSSQVEMEWYKINIGVDSNTKVAQFMNERMHILAFDQTKEERYQIQMDSFINILTPAELLVYNLYYPSKLKQNSKKIPISDSTYKYIYNQLNHPKISEGSTYSDAQQRWISANRKFIVAKINLFLVDHFPTQKMMFLIEHNDLYECIPTLLGAAKRQMVKQDFVILSLLYVMIDENSFPNKKKSMTYKRMEKAGKAGKILFNPLLNAEIKRLAEEYYLFRTQGK